MAHPVDAPNPLNLKTLVLSGALRAIYFKDQDDDEFPRDDHRAHRRGA